MTEQFKLEPLPLLDGPDYVTIEWWDETSQFDPHPSVRWVGLEYLERRYRCRVPAGLTDEQAMDWIDQHLEQVTWLDEKEEESWTTRKSLSSEEEQSPTSEATLASAPSPMAELPEDSQNCPKK